MSTTDRKRQQDSSTGENEKKYYCDVGGHDNTSFPFGNIHFAPESPELPESFSGLNVNKTGNDFCNTD